MYGICLPQRGTRPLYKDPNPSSADILLMVENILLGYSFPGLESWIFSLIAYHGHKKISAITSAEPEAIDHPMTLYLVAFYVPTTFAKRSLKI